MGELSVSKQSSIILNSPGSFRLQMCCSISKPDCVKTDWCRKLKPRFAVFIPHSVNLGKDEQNI